MTAGLVISCACQESEGLKYVNYTFFVNSCYVTSIPASL